AGDGEPGGADDAERLTLSQEETARRVTVRVSGELVSNSVERFSSFVENVAAATRKPVEIDFSECSFIDSFALSRLNAIRKRLKTKKHTFYITGMKPSTRKIFEITKLDRLFDIR
ncbi:MAG: STAS domain-containing protein, partial [bacterium]